MRFYPEDTIRIRQEARAEIGGDEVEECGIVVRVWHVDHERLPMDDDYDDPTGLARALIEGEYGIELYPSHRKMIVMEDVLEVVDRAFQVGDVCKRVERRSPNSTAPHPLQHLSGVVTDVTLSVDLRHVISKQRIAETVPADDIRPTEHISIGDHVVHGDWLGVVEYKFVEAQVASQFQPDQLRKAGSAHSHSLRYGPVVSDPREEENPMINRIRPVHLRPQYHPQVVAKRTTWVAIDWLAINGKLTPEEQAARPKPERFWCHLHQLTLVRQFLNHKYALDDAVEFKSPELTQRYGLIATQHADNVKCSVMRVVGVHSAVNVLWQNGTETVESSTNLIPFMEMDDHDVWPGDHVLFRDTDGTDRGAVVRSMDPAERTATIALYCKDTPLVDPATERVVSVLDIKTPGSQDYPLGVHRGDVVMVSGTLGSYVPPTVGRIGAPHMSDDMSEEELLAKLEEMGGFMMRALPDKKLSPLKIPKTGAQAAEVDWYGAVVDLAQNGAVVVELPSGRRDEVTMDKVTLLDDGFDDTGDDDWSEDDEDDDEDMSDEEDVPWTTEEGAEAEEEEWEDFDEGADEVMKDGEKDAVAVTSDEAPTTNGTKAAAADAKLATFAIIEEAPTDHAFLRAPPTAAPHRQFLSRLQREYSILRSSLPDTIMVRGYEDRTDLLRALIIGTPGTPYEDAPICIDFQLKPNYPYEPPVAHFHSWSDGQGRLSPNLYEEGRICLSVLNTWSGEQSESWNPAKSTLLQVLVSIQGLVLVAEPYFTEPGYERQADTEQGKLNSRHYSERAYVIARRFILHAVRKPIQGMENEVQVLYRDRGRLRQVVDKAASLCGKPGAPGLPSGAWSEGAAMTKGGLLSLERILVDLTREVEAADAK